MNRNARDLSGVLRTIVDAKLDEVAGLRRDPGSIEARAAGRSAVPDFEAALRSGSSVAVIAEYKRRSPSAGSIREDRDVTVVARGYEDAGAAAVSILTDESFFGGALADLEAAAGAVTIPLLRKDFTIDTLQVYEARGAGASAVLLIARILDDAELGDLLALSAEVGLAALVEVHDETEVERALKAGARIVGVNNRDLATFTTDLAVTERLARALPPDVLLVGESGIRGVADVERLAAAGADAVLVGETLMRAPDPAALIGSFAAVARRAR